MDINQIEPIARLVNEFSKLPSVGKKTAERYAYSIIKASDDFNGDLYGTLHCTLGTKGSEYVLFSGTMPLIGYTYIISDGKLNIRTKKGSYLFQPFYVLN